MKNNFLLCTLSLLSLYCPANTPHIHTKNAILGKPNRGRFGDQLFCYFRAKWLSYKFNVPLFYIPFNYSDQLMIHEQEKVYKPKHDQLFSNSIHLSSPFTGELIPESNTLYTCDWNIRVQVNWNDRAFVEQVKNNISPRHDLNKITPPPGYVSVAAHVRNGGGFYFDYPEKQQKHFLRFAPEQFFIDQIARVAEMFPDQKLYVFIFTDHKEPRVLKYRFKKALNNQRITFDCRRINSHNLNVLEDFFSMMDFHCLIRPTSNFSKSIQCIGNNKLVIHPSGFHNNAQGQPIIDTITIDTRAEINEPWQSYKITIA